MEKTRDEVLEVNKWNLDLIFDSIDAWNKEYDILESRIEELTKYQGVLASSAQTLYEFMKLDESLSIMVERLFGYAHMNNDADTTDPIYQTLYGKISNLYTKYQTVTSYVVPELLKEEYDKIEQMMNELPTLAEYKRFFKEIFRYKKHILTEQEEALIASFSKVLASGDDTYGVLCNSDMKFGNITDESGKEVELTNSSYGLYIESKDRRVRKQTFDTIYKTYEQFASTIASTLSSTVEASTVSAKVKHYPSSIEMSLDSDEVDKSVYLNLIQATRNNLPVLFDYYKLKKELLGLDELHLYDIYAPMIVDHSKNYTFEEAKDIVLNVVSIFGEEYVNAVKEAFSERWIDIYPNKGKRSGAYSGGSYTTKPYILLNFQGKANDVSTLIHEMGHSMHSYFTRKYNPYITGDYEIFVAEVASTVNELLLNKYLLDTVTDKNERLSILNNMLELFKGSIFRQTMFAEFEMKLHEMVESGGVITKDSTSTLYENIVKDYFGDGVVVDSAIKYEWARIPHFYSPFYVYKYATGLSAACKIVTDLLSGTEDAKEHYIDFLKSGSTDSPIELLKIAGVDMNDPAVVESAITMFKDTIEQMKQELNS